MPILGLTSSSKNILTRGTVKYPESQLGVFDIGRGEAVPDEASWVFVISQDYGKPNLLGNPGFEIDLIDWKLYTPPDKTPLHVDTLPGYLGNSAVMVSDELGYKGGLSQYFLNVPPNTTFHYRAMVKTVDAEDLEARVLHWSIRVGGVGREDGAWGDIQGSQDWALYELSFTTPDEISSSVSFNPVLIYNRGEVWIDEVSLTIEGWQPSPTPAILNWYRLHRSWGPYNPFVTEADLKYVEQGFKTVSTGNFWGIIFIGEEHYRAHVGFNDDVNTTWFGERMLGYPLYLAESPGATVDQWKDEMFLRMIRGFYNYFHPLMKVGITTSRSSLVRTTTTSSSPVSYYFGDPAFAFITEYYDFVVIYDYALNLEDYTEKTRPYFDFIDQNYQKQKKFWILTRRWIKNAETWEPEAMALEMKNCFDRKIAVTCYYRNDPPLADVWPLMLNARELYNQKVPYYEISVNGKNLLTGYVGDTYGWVEE